MAEICNGWNHLANYNYSDRRRIWIIWNPNLVHVRIIQEAEQLMHCEVRFLQTNTSLLVTSVYALNRGIGRRNLWSQLSLIASHTTLPWTALGDFNIIRYTHEFLWGTGPSARDLEDFNSWIDCNSVEDLRSFGQTLSWNNRSNEENWKFRRLDRALVNEEWLFQYPSSFASYLLPGLSDHTPIIIQFNQTSQIPKIPFKFFSMWLDDLSVFEVVERAWTPRRRHQLEAIQAQIAISPLDQALREEENRIKDSYVKSANKEEAFFRQKSRIQWLNLGDSNTAFFHSAMKARKNQNSIQGTGTADGSISTNPDEIADTMVAYFKSLLNKEDSALPIHPNNFPNPSRILSEEDSLQLTNFFSAADIWNVIKNSDGNKSPGPDGLNGRFFQAFWYLIGPDVVKAIQFFFRKGKILPQLNATFISLLPKSPEASSPEKYRPISLCNFLYKVISKLMANRLKPILNKLISPFQSAFIKGRSIQDNILIAHDLCHNFHRRNQEKAMCIKMDLKKAFDSVNRSSLLTFMRKIGFPEIWCKWVHECISTPSFSVLVNGSLRGFFRSSNGLRQGDPLSPLLFCFVMEMFSCLLSSFHAQGLISSPFSKGDLTISHTLFADDVMIYANPNSISAAGIINCLDSFKLCSGLEFNPIKSEVFFAGIQNCTKRVICNILKIEEGKFPIKYLGLPLITFRLSSRDCQPIIDKIRQRISSWSTRLLSRAGRVEMVNPKSKVGLEIRKLADLNLASQIKQLWHILSMKDSPWVIWFDRKYIRGRSFWSLPMPTSPSWAARSILKARDFASKHICYIVGSQAPLKFWTDPWHPKGPLVSQSSIGSIINFIPLKATIDKAKSQGWWDMIQEHPQLLDLKQVINSGLFSESDTPQNSASPLGNQCKINYAPEINSISSVPTKTIHASSATLLRKVPTTFSSTVLTRPGFGAGFFAASLLGRSKRNRSLMRKAGSGINSRRRGRHIHLPEFFSLLLST
ncbi:uncharacterized protein LOC143878157 [Tasmannia lanceolata]|uniref:uncharacterized protein LOC143878157 n=1 Tax=Tasmannia lanceolata TaxID=3420 RepID=UPI004064BC11